MRLIDADKLKEELKVNGLGYQYYMLDNAPTVKAIPIEWIKEWQNRHEWEYQAFFRMKDGKPKYAIECMIEDWEKENATEVND